MRVVNIEPEVLVRRHDLVVELARRSMCLSSKCGAILVREDLEGLLIGHGYNAPPGDSEKHRRCGRTRPSALKPKADRTCCQHAEKRALFEALRAFPTAVVGATMYFTRVNEQNEPVPSGRPYCTGCSKDALDLGVSGWVLWHGDGPRWYSASQYNDLSHEYDHSVSTIPPPLPERRRE